MTIPPIYDPNIPDFPTDSLATTQPDLFNNFSLLFDIFMKNHVSLTDPTNPGNHTVIELLEKSNAIQTDLDNISIYTKNVEGQTDQVFFRYQGNGQEFQFTNYQLYSIKPTKESMQFFTFLPGGLIVYFGFGTFTKANKGILYIKPVISKNIITLYFTPRGKANNIFLDAQISKNTDGYVEGIALISYFELVNPPPCDYIIIGNV